MLEEKCLLAVLGSGQPPVQPCEDHSCCLMHSSHLLLFNAFYWVTKSLPQPLTHAHPYQDWVCVPLLDVAPACPSDNRTCFYQGPLMEKGLKVLLCPLLFIWKCRSQRILSVSHTPVGFRWDSGSYALQIYWNWPLLVREGVFCSPWHGQQGSDPNL